MQYSEIICLFLCFLDGFRLRMTNASAFSLFSNNINLMVFSLVCVCVWTRHCDIFVGSRSFYASKMPHPHTQRVSVTDENELWFFLPLLFQTNWDSSFGLFLCVWHFTCFYFVWQSWRLPRTETEYFPYLKQIREWSHFDAPLYVFIKNEHSTGDIYSFTISVIFPLHFWRQSTATWEIWGFEDSTEQFRCPWIRHDITKKNYLLLCCIDVQKFTVYSFFGLNLGEICLNAKYAKHFRCSQIRFVRREEKTETDRRTHMQ